VSYDRVSQAEMQETYVPERWAGTLACCLAHHRRMFWMSWWKCWVHAGGMKPCEAMEGEPDPEELHCHYCGTRVIPGGGDALWEHVPDGQGWWEHRGGAPSADYWHDGKWTDKCAISPTFHHEVTRLRFTEVKQAG
jgi:hypothetical protein